MPALAATNSPTTAPVKPKPMLNFIAENSHGIDDGTTTFRKTCQRLPPNAEVRSSNSLSRARRLAAAVRNATRKTVENVNATFIQSPTPNQSKKIGVRAIFGRLL